MSNDFDRTCGTLASALTAFFDGQATPAETRLARAHLRDCARCAEAWLDWEQARALLLSDATVAPAGLAQRILMACRLEGLKRVGVSRERAEPIRSLPPETVAMRLGLHSFDNFRDDESENVAPPAFLYESILNLTTRAGALNAEENTDSEAWNADVVLMDEPVLAHSGTARGFSAVRLVRRTFAMAGPALLLWMIWPGAHTRFVAETEAPVPVSRVALAPLAFVAAPRPAVRTALPVAARTVATGLVRKVAARVLPRAKEKAFVPVPEIVPVSAEISGRERQPQLEREQQQPHFVRARLIETVVRRPQEDDSFVRATPAPAPVIARAIIAKPKPVANITRMAMLPAIKPFASKSGGTLRVAARMLTTVSFAPDAMRSNTAAAVMTRASARVTPELDSVGNEENSSDERLAAASVVESYRATLAENSDDLSAAIEG